MMNEEDSNDPSWGFLVGAAQANSGAAQTGKQLHEVDWSWMRSKRAAIELGRRQNGGTAARLRSRLEGSWRRSSLSKLSSRLPRLSKSSVELEESPWGGGIAANGREHARFARLVRTSGGSFVGFLANPTPVEARVARGELAGASCGQRWPCR